jgi:hypothetical protein
MKTGTSSLGVASVVGEILEIDDIASRRIGRKRNMLSQTAAHGFWL